MFHQIIHIVKIDQADLKQETGISKVKLKPFRKQLRTYTSTCFSTRWLKCVSATSLFGWEKILTQSVQDRRSGLHSHTFHTTQHHNSIITSGHQWQASFVNHISSVSQICTLHHQKKKTDSLGNLKCSNKSLDFMSPCRQ